MQVAMRTLALSVAAAVICCMTQPIHPQTDAGQSSSFQGKYIRIDKTSDFMTLGPDGVFTLFLGGKLYEGTYKIEGDTLSVTGPRINRHLKETQITGNTIRDTLGTLWEKQVESSRAPAPSQGGQPTQVGQFAAFAGEYLLERTGSRYTLLPDGSSTISNPGLTTLHCLSAIDGDWIRVTGKIGKSTIPIWNIKIQGNKLYLNGISELARQGGSPGSAPEATQAMAPSPAPMPEIVPPPVAAPAPMPEIAPPPPPADTPPPTIALGQTIDQVTAGFGAPLKVAKLGVKTIFYYKDMKVTFTNGKVSNVE